MGSYDQPRILDPQPRVFDPLDLEIIDRVFETACARLEALALLSDREPHDEREKKVRKLVFDFAHRSKLAGHVDFDELSELVLEQMARLWPAPIPKKPPEGSPVASDERRCRGRWLPSGCAPLPSPTLRASSRVPMAPTRRQ